MLLAKLYSFWESKEKIRQVYVPKIKLDPPISNLFLVLHFDLKKVGVPLTFIKIKCINGI